MDNQVQKDILRQYIAQIYVEPLIRKVKPQLHPAEVLINKTKRGYYWTTWCYQNFETHAETRSDRSIKMYPSIMLALGDAIESLLKHLKNKYGTEDIESISIKTIPKEPWLDEIQK